MKRTKRLKLVLIRRNTKLKDSYRVVIIKRLYRDKYRMVKLMIK